MSAAAWECRIPLLRGAVWRCVFDHHGRASVILVAPPAGERWA